MTEHVAVRPRYYESEPVVSAVKPVQPAKAPTQEEVDAAPKKGILSTIYDNKITVLIIVIVIVIIGILAYMFWGQDGVQPIVKPKPRRQNVEPDIENQLENNGDNKNSSGDKNNGSQNVDGTTMVQPAQKQPTQKQPTQPPVQKPQTNLDDLLKRGRDALANGVRPEDNITPDDAKTDDEILELMEDSSDDESNVSITLNEKTDSSQLPLTAGADDNPIGNATAPVADNLDPTLCITLVNGRQCKNKRKINGLCAKHNKK